MIYSLDFDEDLLTAFSHSFERSATLFDQTTQSFVAMDVSTWTPLFYTIIDQIQHIEEVIIGNGNQGQGIRNII
jgi:hypothetical protein